MTEKRQEQYKTKHQPEIRLLTLSTCFFCTTVKKMLNEAGLLYTCTDLDLLPVEERDRQLAEIRQFNPEESFPIVIIRQYRHCGLSAGTH